MRILHLLNTLAPVGGIETYVLKLLPLLESYGHENIVIYQQEHARMPTGVEYTTHYVPSSAHPQQDRHEIVAAARMYAPSVIYVHDVAEPLVIEELAAIAPIVTYIHIFYPVCPGLGKLFHHGDVICQRPFGLGCALQIYLRRCASARDPRNVYHIMHKTQRYLTAYHKAARVVVASAYMKNLMIQNRFAEGQIDVLPPHFVDELAGRHLGEEGLCTGEDATAAEVNQHPRRFLFVGRLEYEKGIPYLLKAFKKVDDTFELLIAGDGSLREQYVQMAKDLNLSERVTFLGWLSGQELFDAYQSSCATVMPTIMPEPFGKVGIESLAHGRPVIAFDVGGISDWLLDGYNGFLVPPRDVTTLAQLLQKLANDPLLATKLGQNGQDLVRKKYSQQAHVTQLLEIFTKATA